MQIKNSIYVPVCERRRIDVAVLNFRSSGRANVLFLKVSPKKLVVAYLVRPFIKTLSTCLVPPTSEWILPTDTLPYLLDLFHSTHSIAAIKQ